jgi:WD40 repeat protein
MFDPYHKWLGIPKHQRPPTYYQLLSIAPEEDDPEVIEEAAIRQSTHLRSYQLGAHAAECTRLLNEIAQARQTLLNPAKRRAYDAALAKAAAARAARPDEGARAPAEALAAGAPPATAENPLFAGLNEDDGTVHVHSPVRKPGRNTRIDKGGRGSSVVLIASLVGGAVTVVLIAVVALFAFRGSSSAPAEQAAKGPGAVPRQQDPQAVLKDVQREIVKPVDPLPKQGNPVVAPPDPGPNAAPGAVPTYKPRASWNVGMLIAGLALCPDGRRAVVGGSEVLLWDLVRGQVLRRYQPAFPARQVRGGVAISPDGGQVAAALGGENVIHRWDTETGMELEPLTRNHLKVINSIAYADDQHLLSCGDDRHVQFWDTRAKQILIQFGGPQEPVVAVAASRDGRRAASVTRSGLVHFWDLVKRRPLHLSTERLDDSLAVALSADGSLAAVGYGAGVQLFKDGKATDKLTGHGSYVKAVVFTPDGRHLLTCGGDKTMRLWELNSRKEIARFEGERTTVVAVACTPDGRSAVTGGADGTVSTWPLPKHLAVAAAPPEPKPNPAPGKAPVYQALQSWDLGTPLVSLALTPDGRRAVVGSSGAVLWDLVDGRAVKHYRPALPGQPIRSSVAVSPDGKLVAGALGEEKVIHLWDTESAAEVGQLTGHRGVVNAVAFVGAHQLLSGGEEGVARLWDMRTKKTVFNILGRTEAVTCLAVAPGGHHEALVGGRDNAVQFWDLDNRKWTGPPAKLPELLSLALSADGSLAALCHSKGVELWKNGRRTGGLGVQDLPVHAAALSADGRHLLFSCGDNILRLCDLSTRQELAQFHGHKGPITAVAVTPDGRRAVTCSKDGTLRLWPLLERLAVAAAPLPDPGPKPPAPPPASPRPLRRIGMSSPITGVAFTPNSTAIIIVSVKGMDYRGTEDGKFRQSMGDVGTPYLCAAVSENGEWGVTGNPEGQLWMMNLKSSQSPKRSMVPKGAGAVLGATFLHKKNTVVWVDAKGGIHAWNLDLNHQGSAYAQKELRAVAFAPRKQLMALVDVKGGVELWQIDSAYQKKVGLPRERDARALCVALSADGTRVLTGGSDGLVRLQDRKKKRIVHSLARHAGAVNAVAISADGRRALSGGEDKTVRLWDLETGKELQRFTEHTGSVTCVAFSPDGRLAASGGADNTALLWSLPSSSKE